MTQYQLFYWDGIQTEYVYLYILTYSMGFAYNDSVSVILLRYNTDRVRVSLHVKISDKVCIQWFSISYSTEMEYRQSTCIFTMLKYSMDFVYNDSVSVILLRRNTDRERVILHVKIFDGFIYNDSVSIILLRWNTNRVRVSLHIKIFDGFCIQWFSISYSTEIQYRQITCIFTC
jgi:ribosomal protein S1